MFHVRLTLYLLSLLPLTAFSLTLTLPKKPHNDLVGTVQTAYVQDNDNVNTMARRYDLGYYELVEANPQINHAQLEPGQILTIPTQFILPNLPKKGIVINIAEMRLYYYPKHQHKVLTFPIGIGRPGWDTPLGKMKIIEKRHAPTWFAPESIRKDRALDGVRIPKVVPPGPDNPLGNYAMRLSQPTYLIHGTNHPEGVGRRSSAGCIRLYPEDIKTLFEQTPLSTPVHIIDQPFKLGQRSGTLYLEVHQPLVMQEGISLSDHLINWLKTHRLTAKLSAATLDELSWMATSTMGVPLKINQ